ncbi:MAG: 50S ribosomal protein L24 [Deltaproteobacteria bacterium]|nr:50S ribosomal protein L24 [Deltaproteobacteria bacterium]
MIRKNDMVMVITGRDKGKTGKVLAILSAKGRALVEKLQIVKRHQKPTQKIRQGGIVEKEASIHLSNLMLYCAKCSKAVRTGVKILKDGKKSRICKKCDQEIGVVS